jgi:hypothetical protein
VLTGNRLCSHRSESVYSVQKSIKTPALLKMALGNKMALGSRCDMFETPRWTQRCGARTEMVQIFPDYIVREPTNLYPSPATVRISSGCLTLTSSFWRRAAT